MWNGLNSVATLTPNCVPEAMLQLAYWYVLLWVLAYKGWDNKEPWIYNTQCNKGILFN